MKYKALIFDLDGTAIDTKADAIPSQNTINTVKLAQKYVLVSVATGRLHYNSKYILDAFGITSPCIFAGGSMIKNPITNEILWSKQMSEAQVKQILEVCKLLPYKMYFSEDKTLYDPNEKLIQPEMIAYLQDIGKDKTEKIVMELRKIPDLAVHSTGSWKSGCWDIHITHKDASKKQALSRLLDYLKVKKENVMVVGDTGNDLPLFEAAGLKVAMGNATKELKEEADYVTLNVEQDGLALAIEKYILSIK